MTDHVFDFGTPALTDLEDATVRYTLGVEFETSVALSCVGVQWFVPGTAPTEDATFSLWETAGGTALTTKTITVTGAMEGTLISVLFDTPVTLDADIPYRVSVFTFERYVATTNFTWPHTDGILTAGADNGWLHSDGAVNHYPDIESGNAANYHVSPILRSADSSVALRRRRMTVYAPGTEGKLNSILSILGSTAPALWPFVEPTGTLVTGIAPTDLTAAETAGAAEALEDDFSPAALPCGLHSYHFNPAGDHHLAGLDHANYSFGNGTVDGPFSVGAWIRPNAIATNVIMAKYDSAGNKEEWRLFIDNSGLLSLELHDASASTTEIGVSSAALSVGQWVQVVATYDGGETSPVVMLYVNGTVAGATDGATTESGAYVAMENTDAPLTIGCSGVTATPVAEFHGRIALPFVTGKALSATEVQSLYRITAPMVGVN